MKNPRKLLQQLAYASALLLVFLTTTVGALLLHINLPRGRRVLTTTINAALNSTFEGKFQIGGIASLGPQRVVAQNIVILDPEGRVVIKASRLIASADLLGIVRNVLADDPKLTIEIEGVEIARAEFFWYGDANSGQPSVVRTFQPRPSSKPSAPGSPSREVRVAIRQVELARGYGRGAVAGLPMMELEVNQARGFVLATSLGAEVSFSRFGVVARGLAGADVRGIANVHVRAPGFVYSALDGHVGDVQVASSVRMDGDHLRISLNLPRARPGELRALLPALPLAEDLSAQISAEGELPTLNLSARVSAGRTRAIANGPLHLADKVKAELDIDARSLDLAAFEPSLPRTDLNTVATLGVRSGANGVGLTLKARTEKGLVAGVEAPPAEIAATFERGLFAGTARLHEPGLPMDATFAARPDGTIELSAHSPRVELGAAPRLRPLALGHGAGEVRLVARVKDGQLRADVVANVKNFERDGLHLASGTISGRARGPLSRPEAIEIDAKLEGEGASGYGLALKRFNAHASGPLTRPAVELNAEDQRGATLETKARLVKRPDGVRIEGLGLSVKRDGAELRGSANALDFSGGALDISELELSGLGGTTKGSIKISEQLVAVQAKAERWELGRLARFLGLPSHIVSGALDFEIDVLLARDIERGSIHLTLRDGNAGPLADVTSSVHATLSDNRLEGDAEGTVKGLFKVAARYSATIPGSIRSKEALAGTLGDLELDVTDVDLERLGTVLAPGSEPLVSGKLGLVLRGTRQNPYALPSLTLEGYTSGLSLDTSPFLAGGPRVNGIDARFGANVSGETGESDAMLKLTDRHGSLASASLAVTLDLVRGLQNPGELVRQLLETPVDGKLLLDDRAFSELPSVLQPPGASGRVRGDVALTGTLTAPTLAGHLRLTRVEWSVGENTPFDLCTSFGWEQQQQKLGARGEFFLSSARAKPCAGRRIAHYSLAGAMARAPGAPQRIHGNAVFSLERAPLDLIPPLAAAAVKGRASGTISLSQAAELPALAANLTIENASVHDVAVGSGKLEVRSNEKAVGLTLQLDKGTGHLEGTVLAGIDYSGTLPRLQRGQPIGIRVVANQADAIILSPFTRDVLTEVGGEMDANVTLGIFVNEGAEAEKKGPVSGDVKGEFALRRGTLEVEGLGLRLEDVELAATAASEGNETRVRLTKVSARPGRERQSLVVKNGSLWLRGFELTRMEGDVDASGLPLTVEGVSYATATTRQSAHFKARRTPKAMEAVVDIPSFEVVLPQAPGRDLISLDENKRFVIAQPIGEPQHRSEGGLPWSFRVNLGKDVRLVRSDLQIPLSGHAEVLLGEELAVGGDIDLLPGGRVEVSSKVFVIESGEVHFDTGDPANPRIRVSANWRAPDGSAVNVRITGTVSKADLLLSSPGRSQQEIYALLLGGSGDGGEGGDARAAGAGVGADRLLSPILQNTPLRNVEIRAGSERSADDRTYSTYTAAVPVGENLWFEGSYKAVASTAGNQVQNDAYSNAFSGTVDWRFRRNWSLRTELGTMGAGVDLVWTHRY